MAYRMIRPMRWRRCSGTKAQAATRTQPSQAAAHSHSPQPHLPTPTPTHLPTTFRCETNEEVTELYECIVSLLWQVRGA